VGESTVTGYADERLSEVEVVGHTARSRMDKVRMLKPRHQSAVKLTNHRMYGSIRLLYRNV